MKAWLVTNHFLQTNKFHEIYTWLKEAAGKHGIEIEERTNAELLGQLEITNLSKSRCLSKTERPDFSEMKNNISITTKQGNINIDELLKFVDEVYSPRMKKLLEQYFSKYDLGSVFDFIGEYEGKIFTAVEKARGGVDHGRLNTKR